jgi:hypothetical protein
MKIRKIFCFLVVLSIPAVLCAGNRNDTTEKVPALKPIHKNTIKFNPTPMLIWGEMRNITLSYERVVNPKQSFSVQAGYLVFPKVIGDTIAHLIALSNRQKFGINLQPITGSIPSRGTGGPYPMVSTLALISPITETGSRMILTS